MTVQPMNSNNIPEQTQKSLYPSPFNEMMQGRIKRKLGDFFGLSNFGVNQTSLAPGAVSALNHMHSKQDEFIFIISGQATLVYGEHTYTMQTGDCCGFKAGEGVGHQLINNSNDELVYLEIGDRSQGDKVTYPDDDLQANMDNKGKWVFSHKDGTAY